MKISANAIRIGNVLVLDHQLFTVTKPPEHTKPGKGPAYVQVELKNLINGTKLHHRFNSADMVEKAFLERSNVQFLYMERDSIIVMDNETFEQMQLDKDLLDEKSAFLIEGMHLVLETYEDRPISLHLPPTVMCIIAETEPVLHGATATASYKPAILTNGIKVMVPSYIKAGENIVVKTEDLSFVERAK
ncbi:Elongation factor P [Rickettsiales endosymbiont of Paramecium tredecaurelia]|uniref:elongation factor P n=1 Tax=Candidatus Sarmatiella mevalonica TaxID=2770581 RepID=UPI0019226FF3|nr:elongation factor P [Candidatus Sarmatiella mevalonica]MBL3284405.1 Elongation factor P [Candidatus Sarmatiella mevalonica]